MYISDLHYCKFKVLKYTQKIGKTRIIFFDKY